MTAPFYRFNARYATRSAVNELSHKVSPTGMAVADPVYGGAAGPRPISVMAIVFGSIASAIQPRGHRMSSGFFGAPPQEGSSSIIPTVIKRSPTRRTLSGANSLSCAERRGFDAFARENATMRLRPVDAT